MSNTHIRMADETLMWRHMIDMDGCYGCHRDGGYHVEGCPEEPCPNCGDALVECECPVRVHGFEFCAPTEGERAKNAMDIKIEAMLIELQLIQQETDVQKIARSLDKLEAWMKVLDEKFEIMKGEEK